jgi:hypothetical protein
MNTVYGATKPIPFTFDRGIFNITDLSIKEGTYSTDLIGFIQNVDPLMNTIKGLSLKIEMYDRNNHLIDLAESGYSSTLPSDFPPQAKYAFKIPIDKNNDLDHLNIRMLATDWGTSITYPNVNQTRTFEDCYSDEVVIINETSRQKQMTINFTDQAVKTLITNFCNFYHDKPGLWVSGSSNVQQYNDIFNKYGAQFGQKYGHTIPESIKQVLDPDVVSDLSGNYSSDRPYMGIIGLNLTPDFSKQTGLNQTKGFLLTLITKGSPAEKSGLRAGSIVTTYNGRDVIVGGDIIQKIDNQSVSNLQDIMSYVSQKHVGDQVFFTILRDNATMELGLTLGKSPIQATSQNDGNKNQEELYNQCLNVAGKSLCDFLYKR